MTNNQYIKQKRAKQNVTNRRALKAISCNIAIVLAVSFVATCCSTVRRDDVDIAITNPVVNVSPEIQQWPENEVTIDRNDAVKVDELPAADATGMYHLSNVTNVGPVNMEDAYLLAKIAMAEAEGCSTHVKALVILTVMNRVLSDEFPDTVEEVIYQEYNGVYQFTPIGNGRWDKVEPNEDCWAALDVVFTERYDFSGGALYFESLANPDNWHSRNLEFICEYEGVRFYK